MYDSEAKLEYTQGFGRIGFQVQVPSTACLVASPHGDATVELYYTHAVYDLDRDSDVRNPRGL